MRALLLLLAACDPKPSDTADTGGDTADTGAGDTTLRFTAVDAAALAGTTLAIYATDASFESLPDLSAPLASAAFDGAAFDIAWTPSADQLVTDPSYGGLAGKFAAFVFVDADGSMAWDAGEELVGMPVYQLWYLAEEPSEAHAALGLAAGMNAMDLHASEVSRTPVVADPLAVPVEANLRERASITLAGTTSRPFAADERMVTLFSGKPDDVLIDAGPATDPWSLTYSGEPDPVTLSTSIPGVSIATGYPLVYADADGSGAFEPGEEITLLPFTAEGPEAIVAWASQVDDPDLAYRLLVRLGLSQFGWGGYQVGEGGYTRLDDATLTTLVMGEM